MERVIVSFCWLKKNLPSGGKLPEYASELASGMDVAAALDEPLTLEPGERALVPTGFGLAIPAGFEVQVRPRSGLAVKHGLTVINAPGTIDADYRGEIKVALVNLGREPFTIHPGDRIAQLVLAPVCQARLEVVETLDVTDRGSGGFGHTGV
ncbi:deoxyuridine 5'-triphosphate nucleotidohydrolase [Desulfolithobacter dissulfuricans]|uniref:Deoxyuridine 5'-triphosphate nucleotidohydrolase n=1 Tax=Desulfolithobacter dissulfuricans TaxID=2795293 RepID=A0A915TXI2_9BACT|nr:dUTP diphosphatase [Desulfolithobacter dissulfuricans]BCO07778.1 deoxyuridine 5'-triphosphate nucleotidohydrolase [Desulfolithobacter dissulfuricans]